MKTYRSAAKPCVSVAEQEMWKKSFGFFEKGLKNFEAIDDATNSALLLCNTGRLMRICAQAHSAVAVDRSRGEFSPEEALYYNKVNEAQMFFLSVTAEEANTNHQCSIPISPFNSPLSPPAGHRLLPQGHAAARRPRWPRGRVGQRQLGAVHHLLHSGYVAAGLRPTVQEGPGAGRATVLNTVLNHKDGGC